MSTKKEVSAHEELGGTPRKRTFGQKLKRSCARFWWIYLFVFIAVVLVVVLPV
jgi:cell division septal protein FtsQ